MITQPETRTRLVRMAIDHARAGRKVVVLSYGRATRETFAAIAAECIGDGMEIRRLTREISFPCGGLIDVDEMHSCDVKPWLGIRANVFLDPVLEDVFLDWQVADIRHLAACCNVMFPPLDQPAPPSPAAPPGDLEPWAVDGLPEGFGIAKSGAPGCPVLWLTDADGRPLCRIPDALMKPREAGPLTHAGAIAAEIWTAARAFQQANEFAG